MKTKSARLVINDNTRIAVVNRSWAMINAALVDESIDRDERLKIAVAIALKTPPQPQQGDDEGDLINSTLEFKIPKNGKGLHRFKEYIHQ